MGLFASELESYWVVGGLLSKLMLSVSLVSGAGLSCSIFMVGGGAMYWAELTYVDQCRYKLLINK